MSKRSLSPDDDRDGERSFRARFNQLVDILLVESSVKLVARTAADAADLYEGTGVYLGNPRMARRTGYSERTIETAWAVLRATGLAERVEESHMRGKTRTADEYDLCIPDGWRALPVLGPHEGRFTCLNCGKLFNPRAHNILRKDGTIAWHVTEFVFCPAPRRQGGKMVRRSCLDQWNDTRRAERKSLPWGSSDGEAWQLFRDARRDDWPDPLRAAA